MEQQYISTLFKKFFSAGSSSGILLLLCTVVSVLIANAPGGEAYVGIWHEKLGFQLGSIDLHYSIEQWINDGLMTIFFFMAGLEIQREFFVGELSDRKHALLPFMAATGGMLAPALFYLLLNNGLPTESGFGIPMATDIAFSLGILSLFGSRVPVSLKVFLTALAIIDDIGAIILIAIFYSSQLSWLYLGISAGLFVILLILNRLRVYNKWVYIIPGIVIWFCMMQSGVHATITGVLVAFAIPFAPDASRCPSRLVQRSLHIPVSFIIMPIFALCNTAVIIPSQWQASISHPQNLGIFLGLYLGKPIGILLFSWLTLKTKLVSLPQGVNWQQLIGVGFLAGIGFTMSIFITNLAFTDVLTISLSKVSILIASLTAGLSGFLIIRFAGIRKAQVAEEMASPGE